MGTIKKYIFWAFMAGSIFALGGFTALKFPQIHRTLFAFWNGVTTDSWSQEFKVVEIPIEGTGDVQRAYAHLIKSTELKPLVVSLHAWSEDYSTTDPLAESIAAENWNYIHPDFQGPNWTKNACLSEYVLRDIDAAIDYAITHGSVDLDNIFVIGGSGGGYATLGTYLKSAHRIKGFQSWVPISDLTAWFYQSSVRHKKYAQDILNCTSGEDKLDEKIAVKRSPLFWDVKNASNGQLDIYAGITDGYNGSVPISHSILFYNKLALEFGYPEAIINEADIVSLLTQGKAMRAEKTFLEDREILFSRAIPQVSITIFQGGHELLKEHALSDMKQLYRDSSDEK